MQFQTASAIDSGEIVYRTVRSGITATDTNASLQDGEPVILATATAGVGPIGQAVIRGLTATSLQNRLAVGIVRGTIAHEMVGLAQVYGVGNVRLAEAATVAASDRLVPDINTTATALTAFGRGALAARTITDTDINWSGGYAIIVVAPATAVSGTAGVSTASAFIRML